MVDQIFSLKQILERTEYSLYTHLLLVDFKKVFDNLITRNIHKPSGT